MNKLLLTGALIAATLAPAAAQAQDHRRDANRDHREWQGDRRDARHDARRDSREDWQRWRDANRDHYRRGNWNAPFRYRNFGIGMTVPRAYWAPRYYVDNWSYYRLPSPGFRYYRYVRHYDDVLLIDVRSGRVIRVYRGFYW